MTKENKAICISIKQGTNNLTLGKEYVILRHLIRFQKESFIIRDCKGKLKTYYKSNLQFKLI